MAINFPDSPTIDDIHSVNNDNWICTDVSPNMWEKQSLISSIKITSDTAPINPRDGQDWLDTTNGKDYTWYEDGSSGQWISSSSTVNQSSNIIVRGGVVGYDRVDITDKITVTQIIANDGTEPQITEGLEIATLTYTPKYANSILLVNSSNNSRNEASIGFVSALFDGGNDAISASFDYYQTTNYTNSNNSTTIQLNSLDPIVLSMRCGITVSSISYINGHNFDTNFGGVSNTYLEVTEINIDAGNANVYESGEVLQTIVKTDIPNVVSPTITNGYEFIFNNITPKSTNSTFIVEGLIPSGVSGTSQEEFRVTFSKDTTPQDYTIGRLYSIANSGVYTFTGYFVSILNTSSDELRIGIEAKDVIGDPFHNKLGTYITSMKITEVQN